VAFDASFWRAVTSGLAFHRRIAAAHLRALLFENSFAR
jgi:hypothetical protein